MPKKIPHEIKNVILKLGDWTWKYNDITEFDLAIS